MSNYLKGLDSVMKARGLFSVSEISQKLGVHPTTVYRWIDANKIEGGRAGGRRYVDLESLKEFLGEETLQAAKIC